MDQKDTILMTAAELMNRVGIKSISIDDICRQIGISKKTFYVCYETKDALVEALLKRKLEKEETEIRRRIAGKSVKELMLSVIQIAQQTQDVRKTPHVLYDLEKYYPKLYKEHLISVRNATYNFLRMYLQKGKDEGFFRADLDVEKTSRILAFMHHQLMDSSTKVADKNKGSVFADIKYGVDIFMRGTLSRESLEELKPELRTLPIV